MKKTTYKNIVLSALIGAGTLPSVAFAQKAAQDTILNPLVNLEREYTPILKDASKINIIPTEHQVEKTYYPLKFENTLPIMRNLPYAVTDMGSGNINSSVAYNKKKGYAVLGGGMHSNVNADLGYRFIETKDDQLDIFGSFSSTNSKIKYLDANKALDKEKAKNLDYFIKAKYSHQFEPLTWYLNASFFGNGYNYYGNPYALPNIENPVIDYITKNQRVNIVTAETGIKSNNNSDFEYAGRVMYNNLSYKYGPDFNFDGPTANIFTTDIALAKPLNENIKVGVDGNIMNQSISDIKFPDPNDSFHSLTVFKGSPYLSIINQENVKLKVGANINYALDDVDKFMVAPKLDASWLFNQESSVYVNVDGGINDNNMLSIFRENKYVNTSSRIEYSRTLYDAQLGIKSGSISGFEFNVFGGYKYTKDEHLYITGNTVSLANVSDPVYANLGTGSIGATVKTDLIPYADLSVSGTGFIYNLKDYSNRNATTYNEEKAWGLPSFSTSANLDLTFLPNFVFGVNYLLEAGRKNYINEASVKMKNINELNLRATYKVKDWIGVYGSLNNALNQKYEKVYGYTLQGINLMGGVSITY